MSFTRAALTMFSPVLIWAAHFLVIYSTTGIACARSATNSIPWVVGAASVLAVLVLLAVASLARKEEPFTSWMTTSLAVLALIAIVWEALPVLIVPLCG
jgi:hypothetical protein